MPFSELDVLWRSSVFQSGVEHANWSDRRGTQDESRKLRRDTLAHENARCDCGWQISKKMWQSVLSLCIVH